MGKPIKLNQVEDYIFGYTLLNDWSSRDILVWEYVPLGPLTSKNSATTISPWIITAEALAPFKISLPKQDPAPLDYLRQNINWSYDIDLSVSIKTSKLDKFQEILDSNFKYMYWSPFQQVTHHSVTGCKL